MSNVVFRRARLEDLDAIVRLLSDDVLGQARERPLDLHSEAYGTAFASIDRDPNQLLVVGADGEEIVATLQLSFIPGLSRMGAWRGQIEAVRVASSRRGSGLGKMMIGWAIAECHRRGCKYVQLTSDRQRADAHRFYEELGFTPSHVGYKLAI